MVLSAWCKQCVVGGLVSSALLASGAARAETPPETQAPPLAGLEFSLRYSAPATCPTQASFVEQIRARVPDANEAEGGPTFVVELREEGALVRGRLVLELEGGASSEREIPAAPCADVTRSMAIVIAIVLSGELVADPDAEASEGADSPRHEPPPAVRPTSAEKAQDAALPSRALPEPARRSVPDSSRWRFGAFAHGTLNLAAAPFPALGGSAGFDLAYERPSLLSPSLRAGAEYVVGTEEHELGDADFALWALLLRVCPLRHAHSVLWELHACASFDAGRLSVDGETIDGGREVWMTWLAPGGALRFAGALSRTLALELELAGFGLLHHDDFVFQPGNQEVFDIPTFSLSFSLGIAARTR
ncbi:MAG TPA: hypothetical protein VGK73_25085 [Polyangiaceae bacterium]